MGGHEAWARAPGDSARWGDAPDCPRLNHFARLEGSPYLTRRLVSAKPCLVLVPVSPDRSVIVTDQL
jgi:hypothetical protein